MPQELDCCVPCGPFGVRPADAEQFLVPRLAQAFPVAGEPFRGHVERHRPLTIQRRDEGEDCDALVPERAEVLRRGTRCGAVVDPDERRRRVPGLVDRDHRNATVERRFHTRVVSRRRVDDEAVDGRIANRARGVVAVARVGQEEQRERRSLHPACDAPQEGRRGRVRELVAEPFGEDQAQDARPPHPEAARRGVGPPVPELIGRSEDPFAQLVRDALRVPERLRSGSDRDAGALGDVP